MRLAIVHDYLNQMGGAERVLLVLHELFPEALIYTSIYDPTRVDPAFRGMEIRTTFMQRLPLVHRHHQAFLPVFPFAFETLDLRAHDLVLSMSSAWSKAVLTRPDAVHLNYCLSPMRFAWSFDEYVRDEPVGALRRAALAPVLAWLRQWDVTTSNRVDAFAAISTTVRQRIRKHYRRDARIIYPPVATGGYPPPATGAGDDGYFLVTSRLIPYKRIDLAIAACNRLRARCKVVGEGRDLARLRAMAGPTIEFTGWVDEAEKRRLTAGCRAFIFPAEEDFGIAPIEAMAAGKPVVAYRAGGALDTVIAGVTGTFFDEATPESLAAALEATTSRTWVPNAIAAHAARFDTKSFKEQMRAWVSGPHEPGAIDRLPDASR
ncbi:MAG: glycosyltransferase [Chloroflexota bacterium]